MYTNSQAIAGRGSVLQYSVNPPSIPYNVASEIKTISFSGVKMDLADVTNFQSSNFREYLPTLNDSGDLAFTGNMIPNDASEVEIVGFFNNQTLVNWQVVLPPTAVYPTSAGTFSFKAFVSGIDRSIPVDKEASVSGKLKITGMITFTPGVEGTRHTFTRIV